jgi:hypothetical protein
VLLEKLILALKNAYAKRRGDGFCGRSMFLTKESPKRSVNCNLKKMGQLIFSFEYAGNPCLVILTEEFNAVKFFK